MKIVNGTLLIQTIYTGTTAIWPLVDMNSFVEISGPKTDLWLVKTVAAILLAIALSLFISWYYDMINKPTVVLAISTSVGLACIDFYYVFKKVISPVYMLDGIIEIAFVMAWTTGILRKGKGHPAS